MRVRWPLRIGGSSATSEAPSLGRELVRAWFHLAVLWAFGVAQPLFDVLADDPAFFVVRDNTRADIILLTVGLIAAVPTAMVAVEALLARLPRVRRAVHLAFVALLFSAIALQLLHGHGARRTLAIAAVLGVLGAVAYALTRLVPSALTVLAPAPLVFALLFLLVSPVSELVLPQSEPEAVARGVAAQTPVVMVVWDEFSGTSLVGPDGRIDARRFPNFAALARRSTWYPNAATVADWTTGAVPSILTGRRPARDALPTLSDHPQNLFTLLGPSYASHVYESATRMCPESQCGRRERDSLAKRMTSLADDLSVVSLHQLLPEYLERDLPAVDRTFGNFRRGGSSDAIAREADAENSQGRGSRFDEFTRGVRAEPHRPSLVFVHAQLPHSPLQYLPSGQEYPVTASALPGLWVDAWLDQSLAHQALQRHLLQQGYVDRLLGRLVRRLRTTGLWDRALVVVTADHGVNFGPSRNRRYATGGNFAQVANVPLFVKLPGQHTGRVDRDEALTIDILPTIADRLGVTMPSGTDGRPLRPGRPPHRLTVMRSAGGDVSMAFAAFKARRRAAIGYTATAASAGGRELVGRSAGRFAVTAADGEEAELDAPGLFASVNPNGAVVPSYVAGRFHGPAGERLAIAVNGTIRAVTRTYAWGGQARFSAMVAPGAFRRGANRVDVFAVRRGASGPVLARLNRTAGIRLVRRDGRELLQPSSGRPMAVEPRAVAGRVERLTYNGDQLTVSGWAADPRARRPARRVLLFADDRLIAAGFPLAARRGVAKWLGRSARGSGFTLVTVSDQARELADPRRVKVLAVGDGRASELELSQHAELGYNRRGP